MIQSEFLGDLIDDGTQVRLVGAGDDHKIIGNRGEFAEIQKGDVFGLFIVGQPGTDLCEQFGFHIKIRRAIPVLSRAQPLVED